MSKARAFSVFGSTSIGDGLWLMYGSWPFVRIRVSEAEITLWMGWKRFCLGKESISRIR